MKYTQLALAAVLMALTFSITAFAQKPYTQTMKRLPGVIPSAFIIENVTGLDTATTLMWQLTDGGEMTWENAQKYADSLTLGGYSDWRLPTGHELFSIHDLTRKNPPLPASFTSTGAEYWWSAETLVGDNARVWCTNTGGGIGPHPKSETIGAGGTKKFHVRAVRATQAAVQLPTHFTDLGNDIVKDNATGLMWQQYCHDTPITLDKALSIADTLALGGFSDWRVPNIKELHSLREVVERDPCVDLMYFPCIMSGKSVWSSTTLSAKTPDQAWMIQPELGIVTYAPKTNLLKLVCVRGGTPDVTGVTEEEAPVTHAVFYPNPTTGIVKMDASVLKATIYTMEGLLLATIERASQFSMWDYPSGAYLVVYSTESATSTTVLMKQ
jgi:hypothetical protein